MSNRNNILVVVAHPDDEVLGVGGTLLKHKVQGDQVSLLILADGEHGRNPNVSLEEIKKRQTQAKQVAKILGINKVIFETLPDNEFDKLSLLEITRKVENIILKTKPNIIYTHYPYDLNIDHRLTCQAVMTACRPQPGFPVKKILAFETLSSTEWQIKDHKNIFCPTYYNDIAGFIQQKIKIAAIYKDELRQYPHPRSLQGIKILAAYRGIEVGYKYAEAFQIIRDLND